MDLEQEIAERVFSFFTDNKLANHVLSQILALKPICVKVLHMKIIIEIAFPRDSKEYNFPILFEQRIIFLLTLTKSFPLTKPRVHLYTGLTLPTLNDQRDYFKQIFQEEWNFARSKLITIAQNIPQFLSRLSKLKTERQFTEIGSYYLSHAYSLALCKQLVGGEIYQAFEKHQNGAKMYMIAQTDTHFLMFLTEQQPYFENEKFVIPKNPEELVLVFIAQINSLKEIQVNVELKYSITLTFTTIKRRYNQYTKLTQQKTLQVFKIQHLLTKLLRSIKREVKLEISFQTTRQIQGSEEAELLRRANQCEMILNHYLNIESIQACNQAYQNVVEFYSAKGSSYFEIYLQKIASLYTREDVKCILGTKSPNRSRKTI